MRAFLIPFHVIVFHFSTVESDDILPNANINCSVETDDCISSEGSQASSVEDFRNQEIESAFDTITDDVFAVPFV